MQQTQENRRAHSALRSFMTIGTLYSFLYCMLASNVILSMPILGGALYLAGRTAAMFVSFRRPSQEGVFTKGARRLGTVLLVLVFLLLLALMAIYPISLTNPDFWRLSGIVLCIILRPSLTRYVL